MRFSLQTVGVLLLGACTVSVSGDKAASVNDAVDAFDETDGYWTRLVQEIGSLTPEPTPPPTPEPTPPPTPEPTPPPTPEPTPGPTPEPSPAPTEPGQCLVDVSATRRNSHLALQ